MSAGNSLNTVAGQRAFLGLSHTPLLGVAPLAPQTEADLMGALARAREEVLRWAPDRVVLVAPDHYNGFFNELMPPFCIGTEADSVGDYTMPTGKLNVDEATALACADFLLDEGFDPAISRRMKVDHGFVQPLQLLWGGFETPPVIPVFVNAVAPPVIPRVRRCRQLGEALGRFLGQLPGRTLLIGSGGLSHEPPVPTMDHPDPAVRERITLRSDLTEEVRLRKMHAAAAAGQALETGDPSIKPLNPAWDRQWMDALESGDLGALDGLAETAIAEEAGRSAHESKTWLIARAALPAHVRGSSFRHYQPINALIAGFGVMFVDGALGMPGPAVGPDGKSD
ncbi:3-carboxyethylcatechol 2,3-dioxygenase [Ottowia sp. VDI28]|uniref:3-carboxyethylcatechol 2,3-dioxygenase n=1 Tax=Ottowia sp. VDI28 TaxID=3133968 RepID=UPI003C2F020F